MSKYPQLLKLAQLKREARELEMELLEDGIIPAVVSHPRDPVVSNLAAYHLLAEYASDMVSIHAMNGDYLFVSSSCEQLFGWKVKNMLGTNAYEYFHEDDLEEIARNHADQIGGNPRPIRYRFRKADGDYTWVETRSRSHDSPDGNSYIIAFTRDISELQELVITDHLTGVINRREFSRQLELMALRFDRMLRKDAIDDPGALIILDIDHFKKFNDTYGHAAGDEVLVRVASMLDRSVRRVDTVARFGGEEFAVLLPDTDISGGRFLSDKLRRQIASLKLPYGKLTASLGVAAFSPGIRTSEALVTSADAALYQAKASGRNQTKAYDNFSPPAEPVR